METTIAAKPEDSPIKIDSISTDPANANDDIDAEKCEHFSIRGYASEMRNKNWSKCWPFGLDDALSVSEEERNCKLPPLLVPKFRWWACQNCKHETGDGHGPHVSSNGGGSAMRLSDLQQTRKINVESGKSDANTCVNVNSSDTDKTVKIAKIPIIGQTDTLQNTISKEIHISNDAGIEVISNLMQQTLHLDNKVASLKLDKPDIEDNGIGGGGGVHESNPSCTVNDATEKHQTEKKASSADQQMESVKSRGPFGVADLVNEVPDGTKTCAAEHPSLELDGCDNPSSQSAERLLGSTSGSLHRKKTRKVRLLTELLGKDGDEKTDLMCTEDSPSTAIPDASIGIDSISVPNDQGSFQENVTSSLALSKKRKLPQDEEWRRGEMSSPNINNGNTNLRRFNRDGETTDGVSISDSDGTVNGGVSQTGSKSHLPSFKVDKSPTIGKKKNEKTPNSDACLPLSLPREKLHKERQKKPGDTTKSNATGTVLYKSNDVSIHSELNPFSESDQKAQTKCNLLKKKSKMHQDHDGHAFTIPWNNGLFRDSPTSRKDVEIRESGSVSVPPKVAQDASAKRGMQFSHNNFLAAQRCDGKYITSTRDGLPSLLPSQGHVPNGYEIGRKDLKTNYVGDSSFPSKRPELDAYFWKGMHVDPNSNQTTYRIPFLSEKQKQSSCADVGSCSLIQQMEFSGTRNNGKSMELQDYSAVPRKNNDQRAEMAYGQGTLDDVPMEVVELMAKNHYERCLPDGKIGKQPSETTNNTRNHQIRVDLNKVYGIEEMNLFHENTQKPNPQAKNGRIGKIVRGNKQKSVDFFSHVDRNQYNMSQLEQSYCLAGFKPLPLGREKPLNGVQFSATNSSRQNTAPNWQWIGNMVGQRSPQALGICNSCQSAPQHNKEAAHPSMQALGVCNSCQGAPQQNKETAHLWPSTVPNNSPYLFGIPQKCRDQVANLDLLSHFPNNLPKGNLSGNDDRNFLNQASTFEKHSRKFDSEVLGRTQADFPFACKHNGMGSIDLYSNESIPAMHLLSLMDASLQSGVPVDVDGNQRFVKKTSSLHGHHSKEFSSLQSRGYRTNSMKHPTYDCYGKSHLPENFCECMSAAPAINPSFQHDKSCKKATDFTGQLSLKSREKEKKKCSDSKRQKRNCRSQKNASSSGLNKTRGTCTVHSMPQLVLGTSDFMMLPMQHHAIESATKQKEARAMSGSLFRPKTGSENEICYINRNPADFSVPGAGNMYMIRGEDLKFGREAPLSVMVKSVGRKRQKKPTVRKEQSRNQTS